MGQYSSYRESYIDKELANIERELIAIKSKQEYGAEQIQGKTVMLSESITSKGFNVYGRTYYWTMLKVTFVGVNKNKVARGALCWNMNGTVTSWQTTEHCEPAPNEMSWYLLLTNAYNSFTMDFYAVVNMNGKLTYEWLI